MREKERRKREKWKTPADEISAGLVRESEKPMAKTPTLSFAPARCPQLVMPEFALAITPRLDPSRKSERTEEKNGRRQRNRARRRGYLLLLSRTHKVVTGRFVTLTATTPLSVSFFFFFF